MWRNTPKSSNNQDPHYQAAAVKEELELQIDALKQNIIKYEAQLKQFQEQPSNPLCQQLQDQIENAKNRIISLTQALEDSTAGYKNPQFKLHV